MKFSQYLNVTYNCSVKVSNRLDVRYISIQKSTLKLYLIQYRDTCVIFFIVAILDPQTSKSLVKILYLFIHLNKQTYREESLGILNILQFFFISQNIRIIAAFNNTQINHCHLKYRKPIANY